MKHALNFFTVLSILAVLLLAPSAHAFQPFSDTGQKLCYDNTDSISCPDPGQDFYGQDAQYQPRLPRSYTKLGVDGVELPEDEPHVDAGGDWIMTRDNVTGLVWEVKTSDNRGDEYSWDNARNIFIRHLNETRFGGYDDWRLPTVKELSSLVNRQRSRPSIDTTFFPNTQYLYTYLTDTLDITTHDARWTQGFSSGGTGSTTFSRLVRAVRGTPPPSPAYIDNGDGTVTDTSSGLTWMRCSYGQEWDEVEGECNGTPEQLFWAGALNYAENLTYAGSSDWRLPNVHELL